MKGRGSTAGPGDDVRWVPGCLAAGPLCRGRAGRRLALSGTGKGQLAHVAEVQHPSP